MSGASAVRWQAPDITDRTRAGASAAPGPSVADLAAIEQAARDEGLALGRAEGLAQGQAEVRRLVGQLEALLQGFTRPLAELDEEVETTLAALAVRVAGALLGRAYQADPTLLAALVRTALEQAGAGAREAEVHLHPADATLLGQQAGLPATIRLIGDPGLQRGELRVHTELMRLDGTLGARLDTALAELRVLPASEVEPAAAVVDPPAPVAATSADPIAAAERDAIQSGSVESDAAPSAATASVAPDPAPGDGTTS
jgi:flagellar assembly protein FliH